MNPDDPLGLLTPQKKDTSDPLGLLTPSKGHLPTKLELAKRNAAEPHPEDLEDADPSYAQQALGGIASLAHNIPGAEAVQAGVRSVARGQPYTEALSDIRGAENSANPWVRRYNNLAGGTVAALATPGKTAFQQGAAYGGAEGLLSADPQSAKARVVNAAKDAAITGVGGKLLGELAPNAARVIAAKTLGKTALARTGAMETADAAAYGKAASEGVGTTDPAVTATLNHPTVKPYAAEIRNSPVFQGADDATVLREAYKLMTEKQQTLAQRVINSSDYKAGSQLEKTEIQQGKRQLLDAADNVMPSFRPAVYGHATAKGELDAFRQASDATNRIVRGANVAGRKLAQNSPEAFNASIVKMKQDEAKAALEGVLGRLKGRTGMNANPLKLFGVPKSVSGVNKMAPYINALDQQAGNTGGTLRRALGVSAGGEMSQ